MPRLHRITRSIYTRHPQALVEDYVVFKAQWQYTYGYAASATLVPLNITLIHARMRS